MNIKLKLEGYLKGGYPVNEEDIDMISELDFYGELIDLISNSEEEEAIDLASKNFTADYMIDEVAILEKKGFKFLETEGSVFLNGPFIEELNGVKIPLFRWIGAGFILEGPKETISNWMDNEGDIYVFNKDLFDDWKDDNDVWGLQDGCRYHFAGAWYDLEGFGDNGCIIDKEFLEDSFNN